MPIHRTLIKQGMYCVRMTPVHAQAPLAVAGSEVRTFKELGMAHGEHNGHGKGRARREVLGGTAVLAGGALVASVGASMAYATERGAADQGGAAGDGTYVLKHVTVIDATGRSPMRDMSVLVKKGRIAAIGQAASVAAPLGAQVVNLAGKYVIPGLIESHVHSVGPETVIPPLYALTGVTTVREMRGEAFHHQWRDKIDGDQLLGPRWIIGSPIIDGCPSLHTPDTGSLMEVGNAGEAREAVRKVKGEKADFVKVYSRLTRESYFAIADESRRQGIPFTGHCPDTVTIPEAVRARHQTFEHMDAVMLATSSREQEIREGLAAITVDGSQDTFHRYRSWYQQVHPLEYTAVRTHDRRKTRALFDSLQDGRCGVTPTLIVHQTLEVPETNQKTDEWKYLPSAATSWWGDVIEVMTSGRTPEDVRHIREIFDHKKRLVKEMQGAGVPVLAGTDTGNPYLVPGFALHDELALFVEAGLTPMQALQAATKQPAKVLGIADQVGTIEKGKVADLVILDQNPLADIRNTRRIHALVVNGRLIASEERAKLLGEVEKAASTSTIPMAAKGCGCNG